MIAAVSLNYDPAVSAVAQRLIAGKVITKEEAQYVTPIVNVLYVQTSTDKIDKREFFRTQTENKHGLNELPESCNFYRLLTKYGFNIILATPPSGRYGFCTFH